ncbi:hypothetical protein HII31_08934 [Pseudocercospora fuligena]|uniref:Uncharacterized protein n=1 Tax=Pseudocercospora fuligena TaxID=685502 RepID=A0A8H6RFL2_9PEZI|nr:hypothetical protein HII31_08934 [Pseudocercospora fuligena]
MDTPFLSSINISATHLTIIGKAEASVIQTRKRICYRTAIQDDAMEAAAILIPASPSGTEDGQESLHSSTPASKATMATSANDTPEDTAKYLTRVSSDFIHAINRRDFAAAESMEYLIDHSRFTARLTDFPIDHSYQEHVDRYKFVYSQAPDVFLHVGETSVDLDERKGTASVYINVNAAGQPGGVATQGVSLLEWRRTSQDGKETWLCVKHTAVKGLQDIV